MAFARHNIEKHHLIEMVRMNPILWDCRLPHYKRSDKKKDIKWCELGRAFNVSGERVQRTFTSLREIFRRELNHEKLLGDRFTSKWEYYGAMSFLKDVIRERKTRERYREDVNGLFKGIIQEYTNGSDHLERTNVNMQPDVTINNDSTLHPDHSSSEASTPSLSIKEEPTDNDGDDECNEDSSKLNQKNHHRLNNISQAIPHQSYHHNSESLEPTASTSSCNQRQNAKKNQHDNGLPGPTNQTSSNNQRQSARRVKNGTNNNYNKVFSDSESEEEEKPINVKEQTAREILYTKFGEFLSARLNTLNETAADDLMNRTLLLIAENRY